MAGRIAYYGGIVTNGLVLDLDAAKKDSYPGTGTAWNDISGNLNNGTLINGPTFNSGNGGSIVFDGVDDYAQVSNNTTLNPTSGTISIWFKYTSVSGIAASIIGKHDVASSLNGYNIYLSPTGIISAQIKNNSQTTNVASTPAISSNTWRNIILTYISGTSHALYDNSTLNSSGSCVSFTISTQPLRMVDSADSFWGLMAGNISNVQIYNRALSASEINQNFQATRARFGI